MADLAAACDQYRRAGGPRDYLKSFKPDIALYGYQVRALDEIAAQFDRDGKRKFLLEMATGTGKTLLCAALIRRFLVTRNAERVLFIVDRRQTGIAVVLPRLIFAGYGAERGKVIRCRLC